MIPLFITATGTGIGKTMVTTSLCWQLRENGQTVTALKPVISGYDPEDLTNDTAQILTSCGHEPIPAEQERISPWRYHAPLAPNMAAAKEGNPVNMGSLITFCNGQSDVLLVEGVGGVMSPLNDRHTVLDWMAALGWPILLTAGTYLGAISHTLCAVEALKTKKLNICAIILSESEERSVSLDETAATLEKLLACDFPIVKIPRLDTTEPIWKHTPPMSWLCQKRPI